MKLSLLICLLCISVAFACHSSCNCDVGSNVCLSCKQPTMTTMDQYQRSCYCIAGYYTSSLDPFSCAQFLENQVGPDGITIMDSCQMEIGLKTKDLTLDTNCQFITENGNTFVTSSFALNFVNAPMIDDCKNKYITSVQYSLDENLYINLPLQYITSGSQGAQSIKMPLIDVYTYAESSTVGDQQIVQNINLQGSIGTSVRVLRKHRWNVVVYTNRSQVQVFSIDVDVQQTSGCQPGQECIVVADLNTNSQICKDHSCATVNTQPLYQVGDVFYAKIWFADPTYTKKLSFIALYFKSDTGVIFDFTAISLGEWINNGLIITLPLVEPTNQATIQVNMKIDPVGRFRALQSTAAANPVNTKFSLVITNAAQTANTAQATQTKTNSSAFIFVFGIIQLISMIVLF